ncbi:MAG: hypothetical protein LBJ73_01660 [Rickettsiales bacterium]|jgi:hypothetical protein|nr:hypothetical protein [Rickettsiales bacterium]
MRLSEILLRAVPYVLSFAGGIVIFLISVHVTKDENWIGLLSNVAASLLAIPLIFFFYDYSNYRVSGKVSKTLADSMTFDINSLMLKLLLSLRQAMGIKEKFTWKSVWKMLNLKAQSIRLRITAQNLDDMRNYRNELDELVHRAVKISVLDPQQIQTIEALVKELSHLINERDIGEVRGRAPRRMENILSLIDDWFDSCEREALRSHRQFRLAMEQDTSAADMK